MKFRFSILSACLILGLFSSCGSPEQLILAVKKNDLNQVKILTRGPKFLISKNLNLIPPKETRSAFHWSLQTASPEIQELLLQKGADPNSTNQFGLAPIHLAYERNNFDQLKLLVKYGADVNKMYFPKSPNYSYNSNPQGYAILQIACKEITATGQYKLVDFLLKNKADPHLCNKGKTDSPLYYALLSRDTNLVSVFISNNVDLNHVLVYYPYDKPFRTTYLNLISQYDTNMIRFAADHGMRMNLAGDGPAYGLAQCAGNPDMQFPLFYYLYSKEKKDLSQKPEFFIQSLNSCLFYGSRGYSGENDMFSLFTNIYKLAIQNRLKKSCSDKFAEWVVQSYYSRQSSSFSRHIPQDLLDYMTMNASLVNIEKPQGWTLLHWLVLTVRPTNVIEPVLKKNPNLNMRTTSFDIPDECEGGTVYSAGYTPLDIALYRNSKNSYQDVVDLLIRYGAKSGKPKNALFRGY